MQPEVKISVGVEFAIFGGRTDFLVGLGEEHIGLEGSVEGQLAGPKVNRHGLPQRGSQRDASGSGNNMLNQSRLGVTHHHAISGLSTDRLFRDRLHFLEKLGLSSVIIA